jgi:hypothetical protein
VSEVGLDWTLHWILIVNSPHCGNAKDDGTPAGQMDANQAKTKAEMKAVQQKMDATQEKMEANQAKTDSNQERMNVNLREMKEEIKSGQAEMKSTISAIEEKMEAAFHPVRVRGDHQMSGGRRPVNC